MVNLDHMCGVTCTFKMAAARQFILGSLSLSWLWLSSSSSPTKQPLWVWMLGQKQNLGHFPCNGLGINQLMGAHQSLCFGGCSMKRAPSPFLCDLDFRMIMAWSQFIHRSKFYQSLSPGCFCNQSLSVVIEIVCGHFYSIALIGSITFILQWRFPTLLLCYYLYVTTFSNVSHFDLYT